VIFAETKLEGAFVIEPERLGDERGFFARTWCRREFEAHGLNPRLVQCNVSFNRKKGTLRGMHYQAAPHEEAKLVRCTMGAIYDVIIDLRPDSPTFRQWTAVELTEDNRCMLYVPEGFAHGFQTLENDTEVLYQMSEFYHPESARGVRWDDPAFGIEWPIEQLTISSRDRSYDRFDADVVEHAKQVTEMVFWGATGQARVLRECMRDSGLKLVALFDSNESLTSPFADVPLHCGRKGFEDWMTKRSSKAPVGFLVAIGDLGGVDRIGIQEYLESYSLVPLVAKHPTAFVADDVVIGPGSQILAHSSACVETVIGRACIINTSASVDHECRLHDGVHIGPGAHLAGCVEVGRYASLGTGAVVLPRTEIGEGAIVGAGAVVTEDVPPHTVVAGNPARVLRRVGGR